MARLNEAPTANESLDTLKRRFLRQNRDLAKQLSTQSQRVRCLETEVSRLLSENLGLRDEILQLHNDVAGMPTRRAIGGMKGQLEAKVHELAMMVAGLGVSKAADKRRQSMLPMHYPTIGWGRGMSEPLDGSDGRLAAIVEDKMYPRRTLDVQEIQRIVEGDTNSPSVGTPPVAHFQDEEPVQHELKTAELKKDEEEAGVILANLETRRKRNSSGVRLSVRRMSSFTSPDDESGDAKPVTQAMPARAGAKRKLSSREDDSKPLDEFQFSRKLAGTSDSEHSSREDGPRNVSQPLSRRGSSKLSVPKLTERRALGEKPVNTDPMVSPKKTVGISTTVAEEKEKLAPKKDRQEIASHKARERKARSTPDEACTAISARLGEQESAPNVKEIGTEELAKDGVPPKTPAVTTDLFSAPSTADSVLPRTGRHTPPPADFTSSTDANARPGRRARAQVNYAEPSLAVKMRRPTKDLVDAVGRDGRMVNGVIIKKGVEIKQEPNDEHWGAPPTTAGQTGRSDKASAMAEMVSCSPLSNKNPTDLDAAMEAMKIKNEPEPVLPSAASAAIAALIKESKASAASAAAKRRSSALKAATEKSMGNEPETQRRGSASIYDFTSSSPPRSTLTTTMSRPSSRASSDREDEGSAAAKGRVARRHSSTPALNSAMAAKNGLANTTEDLGRPGTTRFSGTTTQRRGAGGGATSSSSMSSTTAAAFISAPISSTTSSTTVPVATTVPPNTGTADVAARAEMRASRRRSMMI